MTQVSIEQNIVAGSQFNGVGGGSTGTITTVAGGSITSGESFYLKDGFNPETQFVFVGSVADLVETDLVRRIVFTGSETAAQIRDLIIRKVNHDAPRLFILASDGGAAAVSLRNRVPGTQGNQTPTPSTVGGGFAVSAMAGGVAAPSFVEPVKGQSVYDPATFGGVFDFDWLVPKVISGIKAGGVMSWVATRILLQLGNATTWSLRVVQPDGTFVEVTNETTVGSNSAILTDPVRLLGDERLVLVTAGASVAMRARVDARPDQILLP